MSHKYLKQQNPDDAFEAPFLEKDILEEITIKNYYDIEKAKKAHDKYGFYIVLNCLAKDEKEAEKFYNEDKKILESVMKNNKYFPKQYYNCKQAEEDLYNDLLKSIDIKNIQDKRLLTIYDKIKSGEMHFPKASLPGLASKGFLSLYNFPHSEFVWKLRMNERARYHYSLMHDANYNDMCVSMDVPFFTPSEAYEQCKGWYHVDQNHLLQTSNDFGSKLSLQGILYVWDSIYDNTSNTILIPKSHKDEYETILNGISPELYKEYGHGLYANKTDLETQKKLVNSWNTKARRIPVPSGALLIFDSRCVHQGYQSGFRFAQTLCYEPKINRLDEAYMRKLQAVNGGIATTHWASLGIHHGVSFIKPREEYYSQNYHKNIFKLQNIDSFSLNNDLYKNNSNKKFVMQKIKQLNKKDLEKNIKPEILDVL
jgi:hypothetical protein